MWILFGHRWPGDVQNGSVQELPEKCKYRLLRDFFSRRYTQANRLRAAHRLLLVRPIAKRFLIVYGEQIVRIPAKLACH
jgi:hypothetical protein